MLKIWNNFLNFRKSSCTENSGNSRKFPRHFGIFLISLENSGLIFLISVFFKKKEQYWRKKVIFLTLHSAVHVFLNTFIFFWGVFFWRCSVSCMCSYVFVFLHGLVLGDIFICFGVLWFLYRFYCFAFWAFAGAFCVFCLLYWSCFGASGMVWRLVLRFVLFLSAFTGARTITNDKICMINSKCLKTMLQLVLVF